MNDLFSVVQGFYKSILEKRAEETAKALMPNYKEDASEVAQKQVDENKTVQRDDLKEHLDHAKKENGGNSDIKGSGVPYLKEQATDTSNPFIKVAMNRAFFEGLRKSEHLKTASADFMKVVYTSFHDELEKIGVELFSMKGPGKLLAGLRGGAAGVAKKPPPIPAAAMRGAAKPTSWAPGSTITGTSVAGGGVPGAGGSAVNWGAFGK